jgi:isoquinoline 1-oxidoreductase beta subunit
VKLESTRRAFLAGTGAAAVLGLRPLRAAAGKVASPPFRYAPWIEIDAFGKVKIWCHRSEMGQGIRSSLPVLIADELGTKLELVTVVQADGDEAFGDQDTDGSSSIRRPFDEIRKVAATARTMLIAAAAKQWKTAPKGLVAEEGIVRDTQRDRFLPFGSLIDIAAGIPVPKPKDVVLRPIKEYRYVGKQLPLYDGPDVATGRARYGADIQLPGMLTAMVVRPPVLFGRAVKFTTRQEVPGVKKVVILPGPPKPPINMQMLGGVAVVAENTWAALKGRAALDITWDHGPNASHDSRAYQDELLAAVRAPGKPQRTVGDADAALAKAAKKVEAEYVTAYLAHAAMEPPAAVAKVDGKTCEVWACTQSPIGIRDEVASVLGFAKKDVKVHVTLLGGGFGRKGFPDFAIEAAWLAKEMGAPVRVQWTREDDLQHSSYHAQSAQALAAGFDDRGKLVAWRHRVAYPSIGSTFDAKNDGPADFELGMGVTDLPLDVPNVSVQVGKAPAHMRIGWLRSVANIHQAFAIHSFIDELAHAMNRDPRDMLLEVMGPARILDAKGQGIAKLASNYGSPIPHDVGRLRNVIDKVSQMAKWNERGKRALGIAAHASFASWVAVIAEVSKGARGELRVDEAWIAADCGLVVNPDRVRYQMEGSFLFALSNALHGAITTKAGAVEQRNFRDYRLLRMHEAPRAIHVELIESTAAPGGAGEPGTPPVAPAVANAWFALTGNRLRTMPFVTG